MTNYVKYPRTPHLPWSPGATSDDKKLSGVDHFVGKRVVVTEKLDGENTSIYSDHVHARSIDSKSHPSRNWIKALQATVGSKIDGLRICGENLYAEHSIHYNALESYFYAFSIWEDDRCWDYMATSFFIECLRRLDDIQIAEVPVLYCGYWDEKAIRACWAGESKCGGEQEGYVVRLADEFLYKDFDKSVAKYVRPNHVQTDDHWLSKPVVKNELKK